MISPLFRLPVLQRGRMHSFRALVLIALCTVPAGAQETGISGRLEWERMELGFLVTLDLVKAGIKLPAGRARAEALLEDEYPSLISPFILRIQADSSSTVGDAVLGGELSLRRINSITAEASSLPPSMDPALSLISARYTLDLNRIGAEFIRHSKPQSPAAPFIPVPARSYTGIIIIADEKLPVHGAYGSAFPRPCLFPKVWDSRMKLVFERNMLDPSPGQVQGMVRYTSRDKIMQNIPSALDSSLVSRIGENPLRIIARGVFGAAPTDPIIDEEDALLILSNEDNIKLLREGRVVIVVNRESLEETVP